MKIWAVKPARPSDPLMWVGRTEGASEGGVMTKEGEGRERLKDRRDKNKEID